MKPFVWCDLCSVFRVCVCDMYEYVYVFVAESPFLSAGTELRGVVQL